MAAWQSIRTTEANMELVVGVIQAASATHSRWQRLELMALGPVQALVLPHRRL